MKNSTQDRTVRSLSQYQIPKNSEEFMTRVVDPVIAEVACGQGYQDFADACWADLFDEYYSEPPDLHIICEFLAEQDDTFGDFYTLYLANGGE